MVQRSALCTQCKNQEKNHVCMKIILENTKKFETDAHSDIEKSIFPPDIQKSYLVDAFLKSCL